VQHTRIATGIAALVVSGALILALGACSSGSGNKHTLASSKKQTIALESSIAAYVPAELVSNSQQTKTSKVIFACPGHSNESYWPGSLTLSLTKATDTDSVLSAIAANWTNKTGWSVFKVTGDDGNPTLDLKSTDGYSFTVGFAGTQSFTINALSACFPSTGLAGKASY
jgi:hypothetical protein